MQKKRKFTDEEKRYIKDHYKTVPLVEICKELSARKNQIDWQVKILGLTRSKDSQFTKEQDKFIASKIKAHGIAEIARMMNRSFNGVRYRVIKLGLKDKIIRTSRKPKEEPKKVIIRPKAEYTNKGYLYLLDKYSPCE